MRIAQFTVEPLLARNKHLAGNFSPGIRYRINIRNEPRKEQTYGETIGRKEDRTMERTIKSKVACHSLTVHRHVNLTVHSIQT